MDQHHNNLEGFVMEQTNTLRALWYSCDDEDAVLPQVIALDKKRTNEDHLSSMLDWVGKQLDLPKKNAADRKAFSTEATKRLKDTGKVIFDLGDEHVNSIESLGINRSAEAFFKQARDFDPFISFEDIFQASRNVWTSNYLQALLGLPVELTPSIFAYSMLYPVSDNYLDDPNRSHAEKHEFNQRFCAWLSGESPTPRNTNEQDVLDLVRMIETQYPREKYSQVYDSLQAIHSAQDKSMRIPSLPVIPNSVDVVGLSFEKGGTSVLADGVLAAGELSKEQMEIIFNYGAFAQLMDDQEDLVNDLRDKNPTLFTEAALAGKVDKIMNRVFCFAHQVLKGLDQFNDPKVIPLKQMSMKGIDLLLIDAVLRTERFYSRACLRKFEQHFPFRFEYLKKVRKTIEKKKISAERLMGMMVTSKDSMNQFLFDPMKMFFSEQPITSPR